MKIQYNFQIEYTHHTQSSINSRHVTTQMKWMHLRSLLNIVYDGCGDDIVDAIIAKKIHSSSVLISVFVWLSVLFSFSFSFSVQKKSKWALNKRKLTELLSFCWDFHSACVHSLIYNILKTSIKIFRKLNKKMHFKMM